MLRFGVIHSAVSPASDVQGLSATFCSVMHVERAASRTLNTVQMQGQLRHFCFHAVAFLPLTLVCVTIPGTGGFSHRYKHQMAAVFVTTN